MFLQVTVSIGLLALARNLADYVGYFISLTTRDVKPSLYSQVLIVPSVLGFLHLMISGMTLEQMSATDTTSDTLINN